MVDVKARRSPISQEGLDKAFINILLIGYYCRYDETTCKRQYTGQAIHRPGNTGQAKAVDHHDLNEDFEL